MLRGVAWDNKKALVVRHVWSGWGGDSLERKIEIYREREEREIENKDIGRRKGRQDVYILHIGGPYMYFDV